MWAVMGNTVYQKILNERDQRHESRIELFKKIEKEIGKPLLTYYTSFVYPVMIEDADVDMIEDALNVMNLDNGLALMISSPGGIGLAAERLINVLRSYSGTGDFDVYVIGKAKSAATMVCFGAKTIYMCKTSELGPVDPQLTMKDPETGGAKRFSLVNIVKSYEDLFKRSVKEKGNIEPYLQQLAHYDEREIKEYRDAIDLSEDISIRSLKSGMLSNNKESTIKTKIKGFLSPNKTKSHGRPIYFEETKEAGLNVSSIDMRSKLWDYLFELHNRTEHYTKSKVSKCIEYKGDSFVTVY